MAPALATCRERVEGHDQAQAGHGLVVAAFQTTPQKRRTPRDRQRTRGRSSLGLRGGVVGVRTPGIKLADDIVVTQTVGLCNSDGVEQLTRYLELLNRDPRLAPVKGLFAAQEIKPQARVLATPGSAVWCWTTTRCATSRTTSSGSSESS